MVADTGAFFGSFAITVDLDVAAAGALTSLPVAAAATGLVTGFVVDAETRGAFFPVELDGVVGLATTGVVGFADVALLAGAIVGVAGL